MIVKEILIAVYVLPAGDRLIVMIYSAVVHPGPAGEGLSASVLIGGDASGKLDAVRSCRSRYGLFGSVGKLGVLGTNDILKPIIHLPSAMEPEVCPFFAQSKTVPSDRMEW